MSSRALYLDLSQWAIEDPSRWARWVAPCPVSRADSGTRKHKRQHKARMDARTRERLPVLPVLVRTVDQRRRTAEALLEAARQAEPGTAFTAGDQTLIRSRPVLEHGSGPDLGGRPAQRKAPRPRAGRGVRVLGLGSGGSPPLYRGLLQGFAACFVMSLDLLDQVGDAAGLLGCGARG